MVIVKLPILFLIFQLYHYLHSSMVIVKLVYLYQIRETQIKFTFQYGYSKTKSFEVR